MADVTVSELAKSVGATVERLLSQMEQAGLSPKAADDLVSDEEKKSLLTFLKTSHGGETAAAPKKITLKRKTTTTLKTGSGSSRKTINVEVRKKRTYVKRAEEPAATEPGDEVVEPEELVNEQPMLDVDAKLETPVETDEKAQAPAIDEQASVDVESASNTEVSSTTDKTEGDAVARTTFVDDAEDKRLAALAARRKAEEEARAAAEEKLRKLEAAKKEEAKSKGDKQKARTTKVASEANVSELSEEAKHRAKKKEKGKTDEAFEDEEESQQKHVKKAGKSVKKIAVKGPKKGTNILSYLDEEVYEDVATKTGRKASDQRRTIKIANKHGFKMPTGKITREVEIPETISVADLAQRMSVKAGEVVKQLMKLGVMATMNQSLDQETAQLVVEEFGHSFKLISADAVEENLQMELETSEGEEQTRSPIITVMGHVDHGKTSLLDYIREAKVAAGEAGGITQHIGAYRVKTGHGELAFLDTPGHAAFTAMRARGAQCTDVVILVVAADDGVMPQTEEAVQHARAAGVPMVVAINKCDKEAADPDRVKNELAAKDVIPEDWGGDTQFINVSAHTGEGIDQLLEAVALQAELLELKAKVGIPAKGVVIESRVDRGRGVVATVLVQEGELNNSDILLAGLSFGRVRAMTNELGQKIAQAGPSTPVEILGLDSAPNAGDEFVVVPDERKAREVAEFRSDKEREAKMQRQQASKLENMFANMGAQDKKVLSVVVKTDVRGSLEAILAALNDQGNDEVEVRIVGEGVGGITENDVNLALTSSAILIGFNVRADSAARKLAENESVEIRYYSVIYQLIDEVRSALAGMLEPERVEEIVGIADVRDVFRSPKFGQVAGCMVTEGTVYRNKPIRVLRENVVIFEGELESLRRFKDDVNEVRNGLECGIGVKNYDVKVGDQIEVFDVKEVAREL